MKRFKEFRAMLGTDDIDVTLARKKAEGQSDEFNQKKAAALKAGQESGKKPMTPHKDFASPTSAKPGRSSSARGDE